MEYKVDISGVEYTPEDNSLLRCKITRQLFEDFSAGNACSAMIELEVEPKEPIPRMAVITPCIKEDGGEWVPQGAFYADTRENDSFSTVITGYDAMLKGEVIYLPNGSVGQWPKTMLSIAQEIAMDVLKVGWDSRNAIPSSYMMQYPNEYTCRELLCHIAAACGGNWIITAENKLLLVPLFRSMPPATHYLIDNKGNALVFGNVRILV